MVRKLVLRTWKRRQHFEFFRSYDKPFFNLCAEVDVTAVAELCSRPGGPSFFAASLFLSLKAANAVEELRYRIRGDDVVVHDIVHGGSTVLMPDETFAFGYFDYTPDFMTFSRHVAEILAKVRESDGELSPRADADDLLHYSVIPWVSFTSFSHARCLNTDDSVPKVVFGKHHAAASGRRRMSVSIEVHHALVDGLHVGRFFERFQEFLDDPASLGV